MEGVLYGCEQGLYGWKVTDCKICFEYGLYYSPVSTPADFRLLSPIVLEQALKKAGTELLEPYLHFEIYAPQEYLSRAYHDAPRYCADIVSRPSAEEAAENFIASKTACHPAGYWVRDGNPLTHFLQEDNRMAYRVKAYTLREESTESGTRYFISFKDGQGKSHELEVSEQFFMEFRQMERRNRNLF